ncbi:MAG TPA: EamA family transporter [Arenimonas sp.]|nr:EamA family transporter [Arenimonas sp.]HOZ04268.1 EamA family transporter [Arenimonas sp.]HPW31406.1 EamA family transporter [Arenimonas sp.]
MNFASSLRLILLAMIWGSSFLFQRVAVPELGPNWVATGRLVLGALVLVIVMLAMRKPLHLRKNAGAYIWIGFINSALPFWLFAYASITLPAGVTAVMNSMVPLFSVLLLWVMGERPSFGKFAGVTLGIVGVAMIVGFGGLPMTLATALGVLAGMGAAALYAFSAMEIRKRFTNVDPLAVATGSLLGATLALLPVLFIGPMPSTVEVTPWLMLLPLGVFCTGIAYFLYFKLLHDVGSTRATTVTLLVPVFALIWGVLFLHEHPTLLSLVGMGLVIVSMMLILEKIKLPQFFGTAAKEI